MRSYPTLVFCLLTTIILIGCEQHHDDHESHGHESHGHESHGHESHGHESHGHESDSHNSQYRHLETEEDSDEGRTKISEDMAHTAGIVTSTTGPAKIEETITVYGQIIVSPENIRKVSARFDGVIQSAHTTIGEMVKKGQTLAKIESNDSLSTYPVKAPISGVITGKDANTGEQTNGRTLFTIINNSSVWAILQIFPNDLTRVKLGDKVTITTPDNATTYTGSISNINIVTNEDPSVNARVVLDNSKGTLIPGTFITATILAASHDVAVAVKRSALQQHHDSPVVYIKNGDQYEVRILKLGLQDEHWAEVLDGIEPGIEYVIVNSYLVKADIEKAGAAHDH